MSHTNSDWAGLDFVTVVYEVEQPLLELQARSFARHLVPGTARRLIVIDNSRPRMRRRAISRLIANYGPYGSSVEILTPKSLGIGPSTSSDRGQQVLKLAVADYVDAKQYVVLDAKNHLIAKLDRGWLQGSDGRPSMRVHSYVGHPRERGVRAVLAYFDLNPTLVDRFPASTTPFMLETSRVRALMDAVSARGNADFATAFLRTEMTEFPLYVGWLLSQDRQLEELYALDGTTWPTIWRHLANRTGMEEALRLAGDTKPFFSAHREALRVMDHATAESLAELWAARRILPDAESGIALITNFKRRYQRARISAVPRRASAKAMRLISAR